MGEGFVRKSLLSWQTKPIELRFASCFSHVFVDCTCDTQGVKKYVIAMRQEVSAISVCL